MVKQKPHNAAYTVEKANSVIADLKDGKGAAHAAERVGVTRQTLYNWREQNANFKRQWDDAQEGITDAIEQTAMQKALHGKDTTLLIFLLKSRRRSVYAERVEHTGDNGGPLNITITRVSKAVNE